MPTENKSSARINRIFSIIIALTFLLGLYLFLDINLLTKDPSVFPDETALSFVYMPEKYKQDVVDTFEKNTITSYYGPTYFTMMKAILNVVPYSIQAIRLTSVFEGCGILLLIFLFINTTKHWLLVSLVSTSIFATNLHFLRSTRMGRTEIVSLLLLLLIYFVFLKLKTTLRNDLILGGLLGLNLLTHLVTGSIPLLVITIAMIGQKQGSLKNVFYRLVVIGTPILCVFLLWLSQNNKFAATQSLAESAMFIIHRMTPSFGSIQLMMADNLTLSKFNLLLYCLGLLLLIIKNKQSSHLTFLKINYLVSFVITIWGSSIFYLCFLALSTILLIDAHITQSSFKSGRLYQNILMGMVIVFGCFNIWQQNILIKFYFPFNYEAYGQTILNCIPSPSPKILLAQLIPDPYFYILSKLPNATLKYQPFHDPGETYLYKSLNTAEYFITYGLFDKLRSASTAAERAPYKKFTNQLPPSYVNEVKFLSEHTESVCYINGNTFYNDIAVFKLNH